uniref:P2X purinoceptor n=1 Tax=Sphaeramia orbicularis TaxID=375764 RepID=A0A673A4T9_9TELE
MASLVWGFITDFFTYETTKSVVVKSWSVGIINRIVQVLIIAYFIGWVFIHEKAYQVSDTGIESSVMTKVKGFGYHQNRVMDVADYVFPQQGASVFCIMTKVIITENQYQGRCPELEYKCSSVFVCHTPGAITGVCLFSNSTHGQCEIEGWCPSEDDTVGFNSLGDLTWNDPITSHDAPLIIMEPFFLRGNFPPDMTAQQIKSCNYHPETMPSCPIFRVADIINNTGQDVTKLTEKGAEIGINIEWKCNFDLDVEKCLPKYSFTRLDAVFEKNAVSKGYNFRFAKYFKTENNTEFRTLHKVFAIRFDVLVTGNAGKFGTVPTLINLVAAFTSIGLGTVLCDIILLNFMKGAEQYKAKKFEEVLIQLSLKGGMKSSYDSGALSLDNSDQPV